MTIKLKLGTKYYTAVITFIKITNKQKQANELYFIPITVHRKI